MDKTNKHRTGTLELLATARELTAEAQRLAPVATEYAMKFARLGPVVCAPRGPPSIPSSTSSTPESSIDTIDPEVIIASGSSRPPTLGSPRNTRRIPC